MVVLKYDGGRVETSARHPEQLTVLAPDGLQDACRRFGGANRYGKANFRLVIVQSRFMIAAGPDFTEMLVPRYAADRAERSLYLLEIWRGPEWYYAKGFDRPDNVEYNPAGKMIHRIEPIFAEGGYEACLWDESQMIVFGRDVPLYTGPEDGVLGLAWMIRAVIRAQEVRAEAQLEAYREEKERQEEKDLDEATELRLEQGRSMMFLEPAVSMVGAKEELWKSEESCASAQPSN